MCWGIRVALGPVVLTAAAPQRAEEEKDTSRLHHPQDSGRAGFPFFPSFLPPFQGAGAAGRGCLLLAAGPNLSPS